MQIQPDTVKDELRVFLGNTPIFREVSDYLPSQKGKAIDGSSLELKEHQKQALEALRKMRDNHETVCLLSKLNTKQHIEINLDMDELDLTDAEKKATYQEIKDYVLEHSGLKVSSLYIAQVKQKCGIIERENYNKPKSEDAKQPQCPPDKEKAIKEALTHFGMI